MSEIIAWSAAGIAAPAFLTWMTWVAKQLWAIRNEVTGVHSTLKEHERRIASLEGIAQDRWFDRR